MHLIIVGYLKTSSAIAKQPREDTSKYFSNITLRCAFREGGLDARAIKEASSCSLTCSCKVEVCSKVQKLDH